MSTIQIEYIDGPPVGLLLKNAGGRRQPAGIKTLVALCTLFMSTTV